MKIRNLLLSFLFMAFSAHSFADNVLTASDVSLQVGQTASLEISLNNLMTTFNAFVFDLQLPKGVYVANEAGDYIASFNPARAKGSDFDLLVAKLSNGNYRIVGYNYSNECFENGEGVFLTLKLEAGKEMESGMATGRIITDFTNDEGGSSTLGFVNSANMWTYGFPDATFGLLLGDTGVHDLQADKTDASIYNLMGQKIQHTNKGVFIMNGKKILKK